MSVLVRNGLCCVPHTDCNYKGYLQRATIEELQQAVSTMEASPKGNKGRLAACQRELRKRGKKGCD